MVEVEVDDLPDEVVVEGVEEEEDEEGVECLEDVLWCFDNDVLLCLLEVDEDDGFEDEDEDEDESWLLSDFGDVITVVLFFLSLKLP